MKGRAGTAMGRTVTSPRWNRKRRKQREREEQRWARQSGPVSITFVDPATLGSAELASSSKRAG